MVNNFLQVRLERSRRHRNWASNNNNASEVVECDGSISDGNGNISTERSRRQKIKNSGALSRISSSSATKATVQTESPISVGTSGTDILLQDSINDQITTSASSRRQRMMAIYTKNSLISKPHQLVFSNPTVVATNQLIAQNRQNQHISRSFNNTDSIKDKESTQKQQQPKIHRIANRSPRAHPYPTASSPCESSLYQASAMEDSDSDVEPILSDDSLYSRNNSHLKSFQRNDGSGANRTPSSVSLASSSNKSSPWQQNRKRIGQIGELDGHYNDQEISSFDASSHTPLSKTHSLGGRVVAAASPTSSIGSRDSPYLIQQQQTQQFKSISKNDSNDDEKEWKNTTRVKPNKISGSPKARSSISPRRFTSHQSNLCQSRQSIPSQGFMYKNLLKPIQKETDVNKNCHEKEAFGAIIETPQKASVSCLHAMFDSQTASPLMPMNSTDTRVRHSLPLPTNAKSDRKLARNSDDTVSTAEPSSTRTAGVASRYRSITGRSNVQLSLRENTDTSVKPVLSNEAKSESVKPDEPNYEQTQQTSPKIHQYYKASVMVQNNIVIEKEQIYNEILIVSPRNDDPSVSSINFGPRSPRQAVLSSWNQKYKDDMQLQKIQQHIKKEENSKIFDKSKSVQVEEKSHPNNWHTTSSLKMEKSGKKEVNNSEDIAFVGNNAIESNHDDDDEPIPQISVVFNKQSTSPISDEAKGFSPSAVSTYWHSKNLQEQNVVSNSKVDSNRISKENRNEQDIRIGNKSNHPNPVPAPTQIHSNHEMNDNVAHAPESPSIELIEEALPQVKQFTDTLVPNETEELNGNIQLLAANKPWEKDTLNSVLQSWHLRSVSKTKKDITPTAKPAKEGLESKAFSQSFSTSHNSPGMPRDDQDSLVDEVIADDEEDVSESIGSLYNECFIEEKKSGDLSIDEDKILGEDADGCPSPKQDDVVFNREDETSDHSQKKMSYYDDDSYISRDCSDARGLGVSESFMTSSGRSRTSATWNSENMSVYMEDERIITKKEDKILIAQCQQMNLEANGDGIRNKEEINAPTPIVVHSPAGRNLPRLNPSPKDNDKYTSAYFGDEAPATIRGAQRRKIANVLDNDSVPPIVKSVKAEASKDHVFDVWTSTTDCSNEERDEAIKFDQTDQWLDRDPDIDNSLGDDVSASSDPNSISDDASKTSHAPSKVLTDNVPANFSNPSVSWSSPTKNGLKRPKCIKKITNTKQENTQAVFDPFGIDVEDGKEIEVSEDLFSPTQDLFMTKESFPSLEWSTPRDMSSIAPNTQQNIGYYNSTDSRVEI